MLTAMVKKKSQHSFAVIQNNTNFATSFEECDSFYNRYRIEHQSTS